MFFKCLFMLIAVSSLSRAQTDTRCGNHSLTTITPSSDDIKGRYVVESCDRISSHRKNKWKMHITYMKNVNKTECLSYVNPHIKQNWHTNLEESLSNNENCSSYVCVNKTVDLLFESCYKLQSSYGSIPTEGFHYIENGLGLEYFADSNPEVAIIQHVKGITAKWVLNHVPITKFTMQLCNNTEHRVCEDITDSCAVHSWFAVTCSVPPRAGCRVLRLVRHAAWQMSDVVDDHYSDVFCFTVDAPLDIDTSARDRRTLALVGAGSAVLLALAGGACCLALARRPSAVRKRVLERWRRLVKTRPWVARVPARVLTPHASPILLLYARDCPPGQRAAQALLVLLQDALGVPVYDLYSPASMSALAPSPPLFISRAVGGRVVLLQTPAMRTLYAADITDADGRLPDIRPPALGSRLHYTSPHCGDLALHHALALLSRPQHKGDCVFKAFYSSLPTEDMFPHITPYCDYSLPNAVALLVHDLAQRGPTMDHDNDDEVILNSDDVRLRVERIHETYREQIKVFTDAVNEFVEYANSNRDYLVQELMFIPQDS